ncbi:MAG: hypothetical protein HY286_17305 [Planctomycetes bacterium]|nr:hypothetical protein [Planctomycetota bacterium]
MRRRGNVILTIVACSFVIGGCRAAGADARSRELADSGLESVRVRVGGAHCLF